MNDDDIAVYMLNALCIGTVDRYAPPEVVVTYQGIPRHRSGHH